MANIKEGFRIGVENIAGRFSPEFRLVRSYQAQSRQILDSSRMLASTLCESKEEKAALAHVFAWDYARKMGRDIYVQENTIYADDDYFYLPQPPPHTLEAQNEAEQALRRFIDDFALEHPELLPFINVAERISNIFFFNLFNNGESVMTISKNKTFFGKADIPALKPKAVAEILELHREQILQAREQKDVLRNKVNIIE